jgi:ferredoxin
MASVIAGLDDLIAVLRGDGYQVIGPTVRDDALVLEEIRSAEVLPYGVGVTLEAGTYRLRQREDQAAFSHSAGPQSWKPWLRPSRVRLGSATRDGFTADVEDPPRLAFLGVRPCDLRAIQIQDRVLAGGVHRDTTYAGRREGAFIVAVNCTEPGATCFCVSMGTGPEAGPGYDLLLTELPDPHRFIVETGTERGVEILSRVQKERAQDDLVRRGRAAVAGAAERMGRAMPPVDLHELMTGSGAASRWDDVAERCLTCGNCTMVCPTCFCTTVTDTTDVTGEHAERWQLWDSCFDLDFSYLHGGSVRASGRSRYRQWLTHKLGTWHDQFGSSGCVGCGRCIVWCPVGIDITEEAAALNEERS